MVSFPESHLHRRRHTNDFGTIVLTALQQQFQCIIHFWVRVIYEPCRQRRDNGFANDTRDWSHKTIRETIAADILRRWNVRASRLIYAPIYNIGTSTKTAEYHFPRLFHGYINVYIVCSACYYYNNKTIYSCRLAYYILTLSSCNTNVLYIHNKDR